MSSSLFFTLSLGLLSFLPTVSAVSSIYSYDGSGNHPGEDGTRNSVDSVFLPIQTFYPDGSGLNVSDPRLPNPRIVSNMLFARGPFRFNNFEIAATSAAWGQFLAHDLIQTVAKKKVQGSSALTENITMSIEVPACDATFDPMCTGTEKITIKRTNYDSDTGTSPTNPRRQLNEQTGWLDGSTIYGTSLTRASELRSFVNGLLIEDPVNGVPKACLRSAPVSMAHPNHQDPCVLRMAGDVRANVAPGILSLHGLFVLEHNRWARELLSKNPTWNDEVLFTEARRRVIAIVQAITYNEYAIELLQNPLPPYTGFNASIDARIDPNFAIAAYRYGHSGINALYLCINAMGEICSHGNIILRDVYFQPHLYLEGPDPITIGDILRGLVVAPESNIDTSMVDDVRNQLEGIRADLAVADILRGRDFGLPSFCKARELYHVSLPCANFSDITTDPAVISILATLYSNVSHVELWVGGLAEAAKSGSFIGPTFRAIIKDQFLRLRDGDFFYYENSAVNVTINNKIIPAFTAEERLAISRTRLRDVIARNTDWKTPPMSVFHTTTQSAIAMAAMGGGAGSSNTNTNTNGNTNTNTNNNNGNPIEQVRRVTINSVVSLEWTPPAAGTNSLTLTIKFSGPVGNSWIGMGLGPSMIGADIWMMKATSATSGQLIDAYSPSYSMPNADSAQDVTLVSVATANGVTSFTVRRNLVTSDSNDKPITSGSNAIIFAWSTSSSSYGYHGGDRIAGSIDFLRPLSTSGNSSVAEESLISLGDGAADALLAARISTYGFHGLTMFFVWGFLIPTSVIGVYFFRHKASAHAFHKWANLVATSLTLPAAGTALVGISSGSIRSFAHAFLGLTISTLMIAQIIMGASVRGWSRGEKQPPSYWFTVKRIHKYVGYSMVIGALINCIIGAGLLLGDLAQWIVIGYFVTMLVLVLIAAWREDLYRDVTLHANVKKLDQDTNRRYSMSHSAASLSMAEVRKHVRAGNKWVIVSGYVYDVQNFIKNHPGGAYLLERHIGSDVTQFFRGQDRFDNNVPAHTHTQRALDLLRTMCVGALKQADSAVSWADAPSLPDESCTDVWRLVARTVIPGDSRRAVVKLEFENPAADPSDARNWIPSSFGRYMVVRIPKQSLDMFLKLENDLMNHKGDYYHSQDPYYAMINQTYNPNQLEDNKSFFSSTRSLFLGNGRGSANNQIYPYPYPSPPLSPYGNGAVPTSKAYNRLGLTNGSPYPPPSPYVPRKDNNYDDNNGSVANYTPGTITGETDNEAMLWARGRSHQARDHVAKNRYLTDATDPRGDDTQDHRYDGTSPRSLSTPYNKRSSSANRANNDHYPNDDYDNSNNNGMRSPSAHNRLHPGNLSVHLSSTSNAAALTGGIKAVASGAVVERPYTIVRADGKRGLIMYIRRYPEGSVSRWMYGLPIGAEVVMTGPKGLGLHLDDSQGGVIVGIYQGTCVVAAFDIIQHIAAIAEEKRKQNGIRKNRAPTWSREQWEAAYRTNPHSQNNNNNNGSSDSTPSSATPTSHHGNPTLIDKGDNDSTLTTDGPKDNNVDGKHGETTTTHPASDNEGRKEPPATEAYKTLFPGQKDPNALRIGSVSTTLAGGTNRRLGMPDPKQLHTGTTNDEGNHNSTTTSGGPKRTVRLPPLHRTNNGTLPPDSSAPSNRNRSLSPSAPQHYSRLESKEDTSSNEDVHYRTITGENNSDEMDESDENNNNLRHPNHVKELSSKDPRYVTFRNGNNDDNNNFTYTNNSDLVYDNRPRFKLVLMVVFEHEDAIIEREWMQHMDAVCDDFELHINLSRVRNKRAVADMALPRLTIGRLTPTRLERLLPPRNLLVVSLCGTPKFQKDIRDIYESLGLPKSLLSVVA